MYTADKVDAQKIAISQSNGIIRRKAPNPITPRSLIGRASIRNPEYCFYSGGYKKIRKLVCILYRRDAGDADELPRLSLI